jgi:energy-coupling factor transporter ATP-binding protein EcfA2
MSKSAADPFGEGQRARARARFSLLGADFTIESTDAALLDVAVEAFGGLPRHRLARRPRLFNVRLVLTDHRQTWPRGRAPPRPVFTGGAGLLCATVDAGSFAIVDAAQSRALICVSRALLRHRYHARYELIELACFTLAARAQSLVPLHAGCVGARGKGVLLMGASGSGKSTLSLHALAGGLQLLSEDSACVALEDLRVTGVPSYLYLRPAALRFLRPRELRRAIERSPTIERRSGARKLQVDLRELEAAVAPTPLRLAATVFLSRRRTGRRPALVALDRAELLARLRREQAYASVMPNWGAFERRIVKLPAYELRRTRHPDDAVEQLRLLL